MGAFGGVKSEVGGQKDSLLFLLRCSHWFIAQQHVLSPGDTGSGQLMWILKMQLKADQVEGKMSLCIRTSLPGLTLPLSWSSAWGTISTLLCWQLRKRKLKPTLSLLIAPSSKEKLFLLFWYYCQAFQGNHQDFVSTSQLRKKPCLALPCPAVPCPAQVDSWKIAGSQHVSEHILATFHEQHVSAESCSSAVSLPCRSTDTGLTFGGL